MEELNRNSKQTINTTAVAVSQEKDNNNLKRSSIILSNSSAGGQIITISIDDEAVAGEGIVLGTGSSWSDTRDGNYMPTQKYISAISNAAGGILSIQERNLR